MLHAGTILNPMPRTVSIRVRPEPSFPRRRAMWTSMVLEPRASASSAQTCKARARRSTTAGARRIRISRIDNSVPVSPGFLPSTRTSRVAGLNSRSPEDQARRLEGRGPALQCPDPSQQLLEVEGLDEVVVGSLVEPGYPVGRGVSCREHQHRDLRSPAANLAHHLEARHRRHPPVERSPPRSRRCGGSAGPTPRRRRRRRRSRSLETPLQDRAQAAVILGHEYPHAIGLHEHPEAHVKGLHDFERFGDWPRGFMPTVRSRSVGCQSMAQYGRFTPTTGRRCLRAPFRSRRRRWVRRHRVMTVLLSSWCSSPRSGGRWAPLSPIPVWGPACRPASRNGCAATAVDPW